MSRGPIVHTCKPGVCPLCDHNERNGWGRNHRGTPAKVPLPVCGQLDRTGVRVAGSERNWHRCNGGYGSTYQPAAGLVCDCRKPLPGVWRKGHECGERCPGYDGLRPRWRPVPAPALRPERERAVITVVIGDDAEQLHAATGPGQRAYAERIGAEFITVRGATQDPRMRCAEKWRVKDFVPHYPGGTLYLDADVWVHPAAPDVFAQVPANAVGMRDITTQTNLLSWSQPKYRELCQTQGTKPHRMALARYWNSGVWVGRPEHAGYWTPPANPYPAEHCTEEHWCRHTLATSGWPVHDLGEPWNWLWYQDRKCERAAGCWFLHLAGMSQGVREWEQDNRAWRLAMLRILAAVGERGTP